MKFHRQLSAGLLVALTSTQVMAQEAKKPTTPATATGKPAAATKPSETEAGGTARRRVSGMESLFKIVQVGRTHEGVHMPIAEDGKVTTIVDADKMTRVDEHNIEFENAIINQKQKDGVTVRMPKGYYNKQEDLLLSTLPAVVESPEYRIEGDALSVDRKTNAYRMDGRVRFMFFGKTSLGAVPATADTAADEATAKVSEEASKFAPKEQKPAPASK